MDLSFARLLPAADAALPSADRVLLAALLSPASASTTARVQAALDRSEPAGEPLLGPATGAFSAAMAARLAVWRNP